MLLSTTVLDISATQFLERVTSGADLQTFIGKIFFCLLLVIS